jgi:hypothetical protein
VRHTKRLISNIGEHCIEGKESLVSMHLKMIKREGLVRLSPSFYNYDFKKGKCVFLDFCVNGQKQYEIISSRHEIESLVEENALKSAARVGLSVRIKMYRSVFYSVIDAMVSYNGLKNALRSRGSCIDNL